MNIKTLDCGGEGGGGTAIVYKTDLITLFVVETTLSYALYQIHRKN